MTYDSYRCGPLPDDLGGPEQGVMPLLTLVGAVLLFVGAPLLALLVFGAWVLG